MAAKIMDSYSNFTSAQLRERDDVLRAVIYQAQAGSIADRNRVVLAFRTFVERTARRARPHVTEDVLQDMQIVSLEAVGKYDLHSEYTYAVFLDQEVFKALRVKNEVRQDDQRRTAG
jgi:hypothetical protein